MVQDRTLRHTIYSLLPYEIEGFDSLAELALDMVWSWNHRTDTIWRELDAALWEFTHNPWVVLQTVSRERLERALADPLFRSQVDEMIQEKRSRNEKPTWFQERHAASSLTRVAYFSMEFMLSEALPIYSGGLGNVAGDQLKAASDLGVPVVGVGLLYQQGYFRQVIDKEGTQHELFPYNDPGQLPITPLREPNGEWLRIRVALPGYSVWLRAWQVQVGRAMLYLLDSNDAANYPAHRGITSELYGGGPELRLKQEIVLGIGGWRLLHAAGIHPEVCHLNEGHAALLVLERARHYMHEAGKPFDVALAVTRAGNLFTTHTAVAAGFDRFDPALIEQYLAGYAQKLGIARRELLALGRLNPADAKEPFNMAYLAMRGSGAVNGVSRLHGTVSRQIFSSLYPRWPVDEVPVSHITNGVHMPSWDSAEADDLWTKHCGKGRWLRPPETMKDDVCHLPDYQLWDLRNNSRRALIEYARERLAWELAASGAAAMELRDVKEIFQPDVLTVGFARRFATYKRPNLLLQNPGRLIRILTNPRRPVQLIIAGKAHPADQAGQEMIRQWIYFIRDPQARFSVMFLSDYDMILTEHLVQGVDVWLNTPRRPWEASGTSGMKVLVNGGINISELDGWWAEAYSPAVGWAIGDGKEHGDDPAWDAAEAEALYNLLENEVVPEFYSRNESGIPVAWVERMRKSMQLATRFSATRTVREYAEQHYLPAAAAYLDRSAGKGDLGVRIVNWTNELERRWSHLRLGDMNVQTINGVHVFELQVFFGEMDPKLVRVQLYAAEIGLKPAVLQEMIHERQLSDEEGGCLYHGTVPSSRPAADYTARVVPHYPGVSVPLENRQILWQR
jgi:glycogen phosphorylase